MTMYSSLVWQARVKYGIVHFIDIGLALYKHIGTGVDVPLSSDTGSIEIVYIVLNYML